MPRPLLHAADWRHVRPASDGDLRSGLAVQSGLAVFLADPDLVHSEDLPMTDPILPSSAGIESALRAAFPHFQDGAEITADAIRSIGREYLDMVMSWEPQKTEIEFADHNGTIRKIVFEPGDYEAGIGDGWVLEDDTLDAAQAVGKLPEWHTPLPWAATTRQGSWDWVIYSTKDPNIEICQLFHDGTEDNETGEANAELIVRAVNALAAQPPAAPVDPVVATIRRAPELLDAVESVGLKGAREQAERDHASMLPRCSSAETVEAVARTLCLSYGRDPDEMTSIMEMCDADNRPVPVWRVYEEQAEAVLAKHSSIVTSAAGSAGLADLILEYVKDLRRNSSGSDDYPWTWVKAAADYLEELVRRANLAARRDEIAAGAFYKTRGDRHNLPHIVGPLEHDGEAPWQARVHDQVWKWGYDGLANADGSPHNRDLVERVYRPSCVMPAQPQGAPDRENLRPFAEWADRNRSAVSHEAADELILLARKACDAYGPLSRPEQP
jgi:hypothetical protein